jgi:hypothetical protein
LISILIGDQESVRTHVPACLDGTGPKLTRREKRLVASVGSAWNVDALLIPDEVTALLDVQKEAGP